MSKPLARKDTFVVVAAIATGVALLGTNEESLFSPLAAFVSVLGGFYLLLGLYYALRPQVNKGIIDRQVISSEANLTQGRALFDRSFRRAKSIKADLHVVVRERDK